MMATLLLTHTPLLCLSLPLLIRGVCAVAFAAGFTCLARQRCVREKSRGLPSGGSAAHLHWSGHHPCCRGGRPVRERER